MPLHEGRASAVLAVFLTTSLTLSACSTPEPDTAEEPAGDHVSFFWVEREARVHTLNRMLAEGDPDEVVEDIGDKRSRLFETGILRETENGYAVELDRDEWRTQEVHNSGQIDGALADAMYFNEVTWCGEPVGGEEFVDAYMDEHWETLDTPEEYAASVADYVDCGDGTP
ncbi:hypothetical protein [Nocardiopsis dassonvillei]|uniref:Lipoprotein n=1 Tax=Nocardiopsis dassonvillei (strain ATCC 23218 / DSM 43111 / CIP 107115 / JCM 7437 / KCTC 9190 / NBRC 14626 / NCTC 10488 / NRRL B-5397 / IMRU 509) TaxID=446468 RepID=D7B9E1_NOCDD|nr:hypothetical protein [Nocardiopsis dassonvillei]ADH70799.1 hypothetical protein Ndas_5420 [Nocardiopsis dassonvillei subsp. dassonvillei DSM 43111]NKY82343.1 hypothetical protein [Nocardiopsis dassonvillei]VEI91009.1 Uncharacterised protein [Nocardiopsis dassonvillei]